jgi:serine/threonine protein kinase
VASPELPTTIGRYEVVSRLGQGGMGSLYLAKDPKIGRLVAIKLVRQEFDSPEARQRFAREAQSAGALRHPNIVTIFDVDEHEGLPFIAMEYIDGETLAEVVKRKALLPISRRLQWLEDLCAGLAYAHRQGVIHRDIKPANLMVDNEGTLKILDFGLARRDATKFTQSNVLIGTPNYMSPEQIRGQQLDARSDIFAVGALMYELLTYHEAFPGAVHQTMHKILHEEPEPLDSYLPGLDPGIGRILSRALAKDRDGRFADLLVMKNEIADVRARIDNAAPMDVATVPLSPDARFGPTGSSPGSLPISSPGSRPGSSGASRRNQSNRQSLQRRRSEQISALLDEARRLFEVGNLDQARDKCDEALMFDPDHPGGLQLMDDIAAEGDRQQVAQWIAEARAELQKGQLDRSEALVAQARQLQPASSDVQQLQDAIDTTRREIERTRQIQETMRRARARFAEGGFEAAIRAAAEVLAIDPENAGARDLQTRAQEAIEAHATRAERDQAAQAAVAAARKMFESGDAAGAIAQLEAFTPKHDLVSAFLATLKGEEPFDSPDESLQDSSGSLRAGPTGGETAHILRGARGQSENLPARRNMLVAVGAFSVLLVSAMLIYRPWESSSPSPSLNQSTASAEQGPAPSSNTTAVAAPAPLPPPAARPPAALASAPATDVNAADLLKAFAAFNANRIDDAERMAAAIRKRDPKYKDVELLFTAITNRRAEEEKQRQLAATARTAEDERAKLVELMKDPVLERKPGDPEATVLPGGAYIAPSEPPTPALLGEVERPAIDKVLQQWAAALGSRDVAKISNVRSFTPAEAKSWQNIYKNYTAVQVTVRLTGMPEVKDNQAVVPVEEVMIMTQKNGIKITNQPRRVNYRMHKVGGEWRLLPP